MDDKQKALDALGKSEVINRGGKFVAVSIDDAELIRTALTSDWQTIDPLAIATAKELTEQYAYHTKVHFVATALLNATPPTTNDGDYNDYQEKDNKD